MANQSKNGRSSPDPATNEPTTQELKGALDSGRTGDKVSFFDPAAAPLGTDAEAAGAPTAPSQIATSLHQELRVGERARSDAMTRHGTRHFAPTAEVGRPLSPNIQIYRPQLTSVLSIANRITGVLLSIGAVGLVAWLIAGASGPQAYAAVNGVTSSWIGQLVLFGFTFAFFLHLCGGIRHLVWDTVHGFELRQIYIGGWLVVAASVILTIAAWAASLFM
jgi:succinate dehydrogenase / fumarate reductase cytochrome b subunit